MSETIRVCAAFVVGAIMVVITPLVPSTALAQTTGLPTYTATEAAKHARRPAPTQQMRFYPASW